MFVVTVKLMAEGGTRQASVFRCFPRQSLPTFNDFSWCNEQSYLGENIPARKSNPRPFPFHYVIFWVGRRVMGIILDLFYCGARTK